MSDPRTHSDDGSDLRLHSEEVSRAYRVLAREEPTPELDDAIRAAARRRVGWRPRVLGRPSLRSWGVPLAVAATVVVGVSVAYLAADRRDSPVVSPPTTPPAEAGRPKPDSAAVRESTGPPARGGLAGEAQIPPAGASGEARPSRDRTTREEMHRKRETATSGNAAQAPMSARSPTPTAPADAASDPVRGSPAPSATPAEAKASSKAAPRAPLPSEQDAELLSPEVWLQRIRELKAKGDLAQAEESLRAFRRRYPDYPLPADIPPPAGIGK